MRALAAVDQVAEGIAAAADPSRADTAALAAELRQLGTDTDAVNAWWNGLSQAERNALMISDPDLVGNTNGIPTGDRDEANTSAVQRDIEYLLGLQASGQELSASEQRWLENAQSIEVAVANAHSAGFAELDIDAFVMAYQPHVFGGDGIAAVAYGDPDTADHTAVYVPGIMQDGTQIDENGLQALNLYEETLISMAGEDPPRAGSVSTIAWIGYDSPNFNPESKMPWDLIDSGGDVSHTGTEANAQAGGVALSQFVDGLNSTHTGGDQPHLTVIGHSYGSTTSALRGRRAGWTPTRSSSSAAPAPARASTTRATSTCRRARSSSAPPTTTRCPGWAGRTACSPARGTTASGSAQDPAQSDFGATVFARRQRRGVPRHRTGHHRVHGEPHQLLRRRQPRAGQHGRRRLGQLRRRRRHRRTHPGGARLPLRLGRRRGPAPRRATGRRHLQRRARRGRRHLRGVGRGDERRRGVDGTRVDDAWPGRVGRHVAGPLAVSTRLGAMRTALLVLSVGALLGATSACTSSSTGGDDVSAKAREQEVIDTVAQAVPVAQDALGATKVLVDGQWGSCPGGIGHRFTGGGTLSASQGDSEAQLEAIRTALVDAGFDDETQVDGHVSVSRGEVERRLRAAARGAGRRARGR